MIFIFLLTNITSFDAIKHIAYATDYRVSDIDALKKLVEIGKLFKARISVLHVSDDEFTDDGEEEFMNLFKSKVSKKIKYDKLIFKLINKDFSEKVLENYIKKESPDLFAMSTHYRGIFDKIFGTSYTQKMVYHTKVPLLAFHHKQEHIFFV